MNAPDMILYNGAFAAPDGANSTISAVALHDGRIAALGGDELLASATATTRRIDLKGRTVIPNTYTYAARLLGDLNVYILPGITDLIVQQVLKGHFPLLDIPLEEMPIALNIPNQIGTLPAQQVDQLLDDFFDHKFLILLRMGG